MISYRGPSSCFCLWMSSYVSVICPKHYSFPIEWSWYLCQKLFDMHEGFFLFTGLFDCSVEWVFVFFMLVWHCLEYGHSVVKFFKIRIIESSSFFVLQDCFGYSGLLNFSMISLSVFAKKAAGILIEILLIIHLNLRSITILILLLIHTHEMALHLIRFLISVINVL